MNILQDKDHTKAFLLLVATAILWSFGGLLIKSIDWNPLAIAGMRSIIAMPVTLLVVRRKHLTFSLPQILAAVSYCASVILLVVATKFTTAANAILLQYTAPIYVAIFSVVLLKEKVKKNDWIIICIAISGMFLFFFDKLSTGNLIGNILAIISGFSFASFVIFMRMQKRGFPLGSIFIGNIMTVIVTLPFMFSSVPGDSNSWIALVLLGTVQLGLSHVLYAIAIRHATALEAIMIPLIEPTLNPIWVLLFLGERPGNWAILGGTIVLTSLIVHSRSALNSKVVS